MIVRDLDRCRLLGACFGSSLIRVRDASVHLSSYIFVIHLNVAKEGLCVNIHQSIDFKVNPIDDTSCWCGWPCILGYPGKLHLLG
jgi:hypothetical protein